MDLICARNEMNSEDSGILRLRISHAQLRKLRKGREGAACALYGTQSKRPARKALKSALKVVWILFLYPRLFFNLNRLGENENYTTTKYSNASIGFAAEAETRNHLDITILFQTLQK